MAALEQSSAKISDEHRAVERERKVSLTSQGDSEARQAAHGDSKVLPRRIGCGVDLGGELGEFRRGG